MKETSPGPDLPPPGSSGLTAQSSFRSFATGEAILGRHRMHCIQVRIAAGEPRVYEPAGRTCLVSIDPIRL